MKYLSLEDILDQSYKVLNVVYVSDYDQRIFIIKNNDISAVFLCNVRKRPYGL